MLLLKMLPGRQSQLAGSAAIAHVCSIPLAARPTRSRCSSRRRWTSRMPRRRRPSEEAKMRRRKPRQQPSRGSSQAAARHLLSGPRQRLVMRASDDEAGGTLALVASDDSGPHAGLRRRRSRQRRRMNARHMGVNEGGRERQTHAQQTDTGRGGEVGAAANAVVQHRAWNCHHGTTLEGAHKEAHVAARMRCRTRLSCPR